MEEREFELLPYFAGYCFLQYMPASSSQNFTPVIKLGFLQCAWEGEGGWQMGEMGRVADGRDGDRVWASISL